MYVCVFVCVCVCMYVCMYACMHACTHVCTYTDIYIHTYDRWVSWSPFVGIFIARISRGRTLGQVINASLTGPVLFTFVWFSIFGGAGLRLERAAVLDGCTGNCQVVANSVPFEAQYCQDRLRARSGMRARGTPGTGLSDQARLALFLAKRPGVLVHVHPCLYIHVSMYRYPRMCGRTSVMRVRA